MVFPIISLIVIPVFLGIMVVSPFEQPEEFDEKPVPEESDGSIMYFFLMGIWFFFLIRILLQLKRGNFKITQRY